MAIAIRRLLRAMAIAIRRLLRAMAVAIRLPWLGYSFAIRRALPSMAIAIRRRWRGDFIAFAERFALSSTKNACGNRLLCERYRIDAIPIYDDLKQCDTL